MDMENLAITLQETTDRSIRDDRGRLAMTE